VRAHITPLLSATVSSVRPPFKRIFKRIWAAERFEDSANDARVFQAHFERRWFKRCPSLTNERSLRSGQPASWQPDFLLNISDSKQSGADFLKLGLLLAIAKGR